MSRGKPEYIVDREPMLPPTHPGALLREEVLPALELSVSEAAQKLGIARQTLHRILAESASVSPEMALRLGKFCGNGPDLWLNMQTAHDLWKAKQKMAKIIAAIPSPKVKKAA
ncbi:MAG: HigA family addiction module antitoxin [Rhodospirillales bacterium]|jgi:addiction module HigA family antidote|nr:HigA family addiction module antitoxin [Rhodospirillales bacterium]